MDSVMLETLWDRVRKGKHTAIIGELDKQSPSDQFVVLRSHCQKPSQPLTPLFDIGDAALRLTGEQRSLRELIQRSNSDRFRRMFGEIDEPRSLAIIVEVLNRISLATPRKLVLILDDAELADPSTIAALKLLLTRKGWLNAAIVLVFQQEPQGPSSELIAILKSTQGSDSVLRVTQPTKPSSEPSPPQTLPRLPADVLLVLRACAFIGPSFDVQTVSLLLEQSVNQVLEKLQIASDAGLAITDDGSGELQLRQDFTEQLRKGLLPSLAKTWHLRLASLLQKPRSSPVETVVPTPPAQTTRVASSQPEDDPAVRRQAPKQHRQTTEPSVTAVTESEKPSTTTVQESPKPSLAEVLHPQQPVVQNQVQTQPTPTKAPEPAVQNNQEPDSEELPVDKRETDYPNTPEAETPTERPGTIAEHLEAAGDFEGSAVRYHEASLQATAMGLFDEAAHYCLKALRVLDRLPSNNKRRLLRIRIMLELARMQWRSSGESEAFTLSSAMETLRHARSLVADSDPADLQAALSTMIASVANDLGDLKSLETALQELTHTTRLLVDTGNPMTAARLLNDQAAVYLRMGDSVRAAHLLEESRKLFEQRADSDPVALLELADTSHLLARLALHVKARPGRENEAVEIAKDRALSAKEAYDKVGATRERLRVDETIARLELRAGRPKAAERILTQVKNDQQMIGDIVGLARTTNALAEVLLMLNKEQQAWEMLVNSVAFNISKGSPVGLAYNHKTLILMQRIAHPDMVSELDKQIRSALTALGVQSIPGSEQ